MEKYNYDNNVPKLLSCEHTFCSDCLHSLSINMDTVNQIQCPVCRAKHSVISHGFPTNRAMIDIVDELKKDTTRPTTELKCKKHKGVECVLVCIDCVIGLCLKCLKQKSHQGHDLEELSDAKIVLRPMFEKKIKSEQNALDTRIKELPNSFKEFSIAESDINKICNEINKETASWRMKQLSNLNYLKQQVVSRKNEIQAERMLLQSLTEQGNIDIRTMIAKLSFNQAQKKQYYDAGYTGTEHEYNFKEQTKLLKRRLQLVFHQQELVTSRILWERVTDVKPVRVDDERSGDWTCPNPECRNDNYTWENECNRCKTERPGVASGDGGGYYDCGGFGGGRRREDGDERSGDWKCPNIDCGNGNFAWRNECIWCKTGRPGRAGCDDGYRGHRGSGVFGGGRGRGQGGVVCGFGGGHTQGGVRGAGGRDGSDE